MCAVLCRRGGFFSPERLFGNFDHEWFQYYDQHHLFFDDVMPVRSKLTVDPITWSEVVGQGGLNKSEMHVMCEPRNFGLYEGLVVPIHGPLGEFATVTFAGRYFKSGPLVEGALQMIAQVAFRESIKIRGFEIINVPVPKLSKRQRECLMWVQRGKSNEDIADILEISPNTVKAHIEAAKRVFGVGTRVEAVVAGRRFNLLGL